VTATFARAYLGFGSNLGDRRDNIAKGLAMLRESGKVEIVKVSSLYETEPVGYTDQGLFLNAVALVETELLPDGLLALCKDVEVKVGRKPTVRWGPRVLDIDVLMYFAEPSDSLPNQSADSIQAGCTRIRRNQLGSTEIKISTPSLTIPHPRIWERGFVIIPLAEINPDLPTPDGRKAESLLRDFSPWTGLQLFEAGMGWKGPGSGRDGWKIIRFPEVDSTNSVAVKFASEGAPCGTCVIAETQTSGRGRRGRIWHSPSGGLWLSIILRPRLKPQDVGWLSLIAGVAVSSAIRDIFRLPAVVKWPNDVLISGKKACGILPETRFIGDRIEFAVVGIGVNVAVRKDLLPPEVRETSGSLISPDHPHAREAREALTLAILDNFYSLYKQFLSDGFLGILQKVREYCDMLGRKVIVSGLETPIYGVAADIASDGGLIIRTESGENVHVVAGEVTIGVSGIS